MFENILKFFRKIGKSENKETNGSKNKAKERLHLVLMQDRANVSADFLELMKQEIIDVIKKYIEVDESEIDVRLTNEVKEDGTTGAPSLYANIPIVNIRNDMKKEVEEENKQDVKPEPEEKENLKKEDSSEIKDSDDANNKKTEKNKEKEEGKEEVEKQEDTKQKTEENDESNSN